MQTSPSQSRRLRDYTNVPFEVFILAFSLLPFLVLAYFYAELPDRVPLFVNLGGEVTTWARKSALSVFRVPLMAVLIQIVCLLMKYGTLQSAARVSLETDLKLHEQYLGLSTGLWDWFRFAFAFKMIAESLDTIFLSLERFKFLSRPAFIISVIASAIGVISALVYGYRLLALRRRVKQKFEDGKVDARYVYGRILYFNPSDSALFVSGYAFNFGNKWTWVFIACIVAYPLLVFWSA